MERAIIVDLDGTLSDAEHRVYLLKETKKNWKEFNARMVEDEINLWCYEIICAMKYRGYKIIFVTGRGEVYRPHTEKWLEKHSVSYDALHMRKSKDRRDDWLVKKEIYENEIKANFDTLFVLDDRKSVVEMWRDIGLVCLQCEWGDF